MSRVPPVTRDTLPPHQSDGYDELDQIASKAFGDKFTWKRKDGALVGPFPAFIAAPEAGVGMLQYLGKLATIPGLPAEAKETAILSTGAHFKAAYELYAHGNIAVKTTDLPQEQVEQICDGKKPEGLNEACSTAYDVAKYLSGTPGPLPQEMWDRSVKALGRDGTLGLAHYVGMYAYTCIILNAMDAPVPKEGE
ncbi:hypothetical protein LTR85_008117 [Meristemomyces frigidus]|nr:hypothetical protein LTR85_008117 [Meristemomyces frigidus]